MLFNSFHFLFFYAIVVTTYFAIAQRLRWVLLLTASYYFYICWQPIYALLLVGLTLSCYGAAIGMEKSRTMSHRRFFFAVGMTTCLGLLLIYKYLDLFASAFNAGMSHFDTTWRVPLAHLIIPVGISFHTFQSIGYLIDVRRGIIRAEKHLGIYALFIVFFPQLLAGPIERSGHMLPQFRIGHLPRYARISSGARWALWGLFKKMAIADLLSPFVNHVYAQPRGVAGVILLTATFFFTIQIYCDFSGYSDIAVGIARIMGYDLMVNFRQPYFSRSISEFWSRWHISLSTWFRDYLYIPLGGNRVSRIRWALNIIVVFAVSGLWHGASVLFLLWGLLHGIYLLVERSTKTFRSRVFDLLRLSHRKAIHGIVSTLFVFVLILLAWVLFRAQSLGDARYIFAHLWRIKRIPIDSFYGFGLPRFELMLALAMIGVLFWAEFFLRFRPPALEAVWRKRNVRLACYLGCAYGIVFFGVFNRVEFIYFQF